MRVYKPSGIEWLGEIPQSWEIKRLRHIFKEVSIKKCGNEQQLCATQSYGVIPKKLYSYKTVEVISSDLNSFKLVKKDNFVISLRSFEGGIEHSNYQGIISPAYTILEPQVEIYSFYFKFLFKSSFFISTLNIHKIGIREGQNISYASLQYTPIPLPPLQEQKEIAEFLDSKCEKIQNYIDKKQKLITLLQEKKQALINEAVCGRVACHTADSHCHTERSEVSHNTESKRDFSPTAQNDKKGTTQNDKAHTCHTQALPPCHTERSEVSTTAYKDRGIEYLGLIPHHWEVTNLKNIVSIKSGGTPSRDNKDYWNGDIPWIRSEFCHNQHIFQCDVKEKITTLGLQKSSAKMCEKNTILIALVGATIGQVAFLNFKSAINQNIAAIYPNNAAILDNVFLFFVALTFKQRFEILGKYAIANLAFIGNLKIPLPPLQEQKEIAAFLDSKVAQIDSVIEKTKKQIELIKEYKNTLINEAVCGRIRVN